MKNLWACTLLVVMWLIAAPVPTLAQTGSGLAGTARDNTGAVLPGVTVEASSPALIEKVRVVVTDGEGRYNITELPPGRYTVTFSLPGFTTVKREGIDLVTGFTGNVNADLPVGSLAESITVTGASPVVDVQNTRQQAVVTRDLPAGHRIGPDDVFPTRPCPPDGIPPHRIEQVLGRELLDPASADTLVTPEQFG